MKKSKQSKRNKNVQFEEKKSTRKFHIGAKSCVDRNREKCNKRSVPLGKSAIWGQKKRLRNYMFLKSNKKP